jgi:hypothetical protein
MNNITERLDFESALQELINKYSQENGSDTPDFILAKYLQDCLAAYNKCVKARDKWFSVDMWSENKRDAIYNNRENK